MQMSAQTIVKTDHGNPLLDGLMVLDYASQGRRQLVLLSYRQVIIQINSLLSNYDEPRLLAYQRRDLMFSTNLVELILHILLTWQLDIIDGLIGDTLSLRRRHIILVTITLL